MEPAYCSCMLQQSLGEMCSGGTPKWSSLSGDHHFVPTHKWQPHLGCRHIAPRQTASFCCLTKICTTLQKLYAADPVQQNEAISLMATILSHLQRSGTKWQLLLLGLGTHCQHVGKRPKHYGMGEREVGGHCTDSVVDHKSR